MMVETGDSVVEVGSHYDYQLKGVGLSPLFGKSGHFAVLLAVVVGTAYYDYIRQTGVVVADYFENSDDIQQTGVVVAGYFENSDYIRLIRVAGYSYS